MRGRLRAGAQSEGGSVLVIVAVLLPVMLGMAALVVDVGVWFQARRQAQSAADAAALAAAYDLPSSATATTDAQSYASANFSGATVTIATPYNGDNSQIKVTVAKTVPSIFGGILGINSVDVSASAVATRNANVEASAVFAYDSSCGNQSLTLNGNNMDLNGAVHTNGKFVQNENNGSFGDTTIGGPSSCSPIYNGNNNSYSSGPTQDKALYPYPLDYRSYGTSGCTTWLPPNYDWSSTGATIPDGMYCSTGLMSFDGNNMRCGHCSFMAAAFNINSNNCTFTPYWNGLMLWETGTNTLDINGNSFLNSGAIFAPTAGIVYNANSGNASGFIEGLDVTITGNNFNFTGTGPIISGSYTSLVG